MRAWKISALWVLGATVLGTLTIGCDKADYCTADLRTAVAVTVVLPDGAIVDHVTARNGDQEPDDCYAQSEPDGGPNFEFYCFERGAGAYTITVTSGTETRTATVDVEQNDCHAIPEEVTIDFTMSQP